MGQSLDDLDRLAAELEAARLVDAPASASRLEGWLRVVADHGDAALRANHPEDFEHALHV